jgi:hypothetical protein
MVSQPEVVRKRKTAWRGKPTRCICVGPSPGAGAIGSGPQGVAWLKEERSGKRLSAAREKAIAIKHADVAELVDARDLKSLDGNVVRVRVPPPAPAKSEFPEFS